MTPLSPETYWLVTTTIFTSILWAPHILQRVIEMKPYKALRDPRHTEATQAPWAQRSIRAHTNAVENLVVFGLLVLVLESSGASTAATAIAAQVYFISRVVHFGVYTLGIPWLRTPMFLLGFGCQMVLALALL